jgi:hypothetical protein
MARLITFTDAEAAGLLDRLALARFDPGTMLACDTKDLTESQRAVILESFHRRFHYEVYRWLQEQGATVTR